MRPFEAKAGSSATSSRPPCPRASTGGSPLTGSERVPSAERTRRRPGLSVTSILPLGRKASAPGFPNPFTTVTTSNATFDLCSGASVWPGNAGVWFLPLGGRRSTPPRAPAVPGPPRLQAIRPTATTPAATVRLTFATSVLAVVLESSVPRRAARVDRRNGEAIDPLMPKPIDTFDSARKSGSMPELWQVLRRWACWTCLGVAVSACRPAVSREARVVPNDNRAPAGSLRDGILTLHLEAREARWYPDGEGAPSIVMQVFAEAGGEPRNPGPLIRVPAGTTIRVSVRNTLR